MTECTQRGCPGEVDRDGYCRRFGHLCARAEVDPADAEPPSSGGRRQASTTAPSQRTAVASVSTVPAVAPAEPTAQSQPTRHPTGATRLSRRTTAPLPPLSRGEGKATRWVEWIDVPVPPSRDPATSVLVNPSVPENKRFCSRCHLPVGRGTHDEPGRTKGFCPRDRTPFSFVPRLEAGDRLNQFEVVGCLAYGGVGWIYLARDLNLDGNWRVLKGLRDAGDAEAWDAVVAERRFLAQVDHPHIVKIYDFVQRTDPTNGTPDGYLVMEYVAGPTLHSLLWNRRRPDGTHEPLPLVQVLAYGADILDAFEYLHGRRLVYCDLKPDNVIHGPHRLKLIDLGAVRHQDDWNGPVWGAPGFQAPEIATHGPSVQSDIYAVGRTLAVLALDLPNLLARYPDRLPDPAEVPLLAEEESFHRLLRRATDPDPRRRFETAAHMREQLTGVLREVLAAADGRPRSSPSTLFGPQPRSFGTEFGDVAPLPDPGAVAEALPIPLVDLTDPAASFLGTLGYSDPNEIIDVLAARTPSTVEIGLRLVRAHIDIRDIDAATARLDRLRLDHPRDWRVAWFQGVAALAAGRARAAYEAFDEVYATLPGEIDARMAYAVSAELAGDADAASVHYARIWLTSREYVSSAFGSARMLLAAGDRAGAVEVLESVPHTSSHFIAAQVGALRGRLLDRDPAELFQADFAEAAARVERLDLDLERRTRAKVVVLEAALGWVRVQAQPPAPGARVFGSRLAERDLRFALEREYRALAKLSVFDDERIHCIDQANAVRPGTFL